MSNTDQLEERINEVETEQATQAAKEAGAEATQAAVDAGNMATTTAMLAGHMATVVAGSVALVTGIFLGLAIAKSRK